MRSEPARPDGEYDKGTGAKGREQERSEQEGKVRRDRYSAKKKVQLRIGN